MGICLNFPVIVGSSSQEAGRVRLHQKLEIEVKTQGFVGPLSALDRGYPKCIDFATSFGLSRTVFKHQLNDKTWKSKVKKLQNDEK